MTSEIIAIYQIKIIRNCRQQDALIDNYVTPHVDVFDVVTPHLGYFLISTIT